MNDEFGGIPVSDEFGGIAVDESLDHPVVASPIPPYHLDSEGKPIQYPTLPAGYKERDVILPIPRMQSFPGDSPLTSAANATWNTIAPLPEFFERPEGAATLPLGGLGAIPARLLAAYYAATTLKDIPEQTRQATAALGKYVSGDPNQQLQPTLETVGSPLASAVLTGQLGEHTAGLEAATPHQTGRLTDYLTPDQKAARNAATSAAQDAQWAQQEANAEQQMPLPPAPKVQSDLADLNDAINQVRSRTIANAIADRLEQQPIAPVTEPVIQTPEVPNARPQQEAVPILGNQPPKNPAPVAGRIASEIQPPPEPIKPVQVSPEVPPTEPTTTPVTEPVTSPLGTGRYRLGRSPQTYRLLERLKQSQTEADLGEQPVRVVNEKTGKPEVALESDLTPVAVTPDVTTVVTKPKADLDAQLISAGLSPEGLTVADKKAMLKRPEVKAKIKAASEAVIQPVAEPEIGGSLAAMSENQNAPSDPNIGREWNSPYGKQVITSIERFPSGDIYNVTTPDTGAVRRYDAKRIDEVIKRNEHEITPEYAAEKKSADELRQLRIERDARDAAKKQKELDEIATFTVDESPMSAGKIRDALLKQISYNGTPMNRKAMIEQAIAKGYVVKNTKRGRELTASNGSFLDEKTTTKAGMDYAEHLIANPKTESVVASPTPSKLETKEPSIAQPTELMTPNEISTAKVFDTASGTKIITRDEAVNIARDFIGHEAFDAGVNNPMPGSSLESDIVGAVEQAKGWKFAGNMPEARVGKFSDDRSRDIYGEFKKPGSLKLASDLANIPENQRRTKAKEEANSVEAKALIEKQLADQKRIYEIWDEKNKNYHPDIPINDPLIKQFGHVPKGYVKSGDRYVYQPTEATIGGGRPVRESAAGVTSLDKYSVYPVKTKSGDMWAVKTNANGFGDSLFDTEAEAVKESARVKTLDESNAAFQAKQKAASDAKASAQSAKELPLNNYLDSLGLSAMRRGKLKTTLSADVAKRAGGKIYSGNRFEVVKQLVDAGYRPKTEEVSAIKEPSGNQMNRMDNREQAAFERRKKEAGTKTEYSLENSDGSSFVVTKAEHDLADSLSGGANDIARVNRYLKSTHGLTDGSKVEVIHDARLNEPEGYAELKGGELVKIVLNSAKLPDAASIDRVLTHELGHAAVESGRVREILSTVTPDEIAGIKAGIKRLGYDPSIADKELDARKLDKLAADWGKRSWFEQIAGHVLELANRIGLPVTRLGAERAAVKAIGEELARVQTAEGTPTQRLESKPEPDEELIPPKGDRLVTIRRADGTEYQAAYGDKSWPGAGPNGEDVPAIARPMDGKWSHGMLEPGETIVEPTTRLESKAEPDDEAYLKAANSGDTKTAQRMAYDAAFKSANTVKELIQIAASRRLKAILSGKDVPIKDLKGNWVPVNYGEIVGLLRQYGPEEEYKKSLLGGGFGNGNFREEIQNFSDKLYRKYNRALSKGVQIEDIPAIVRDNAGNIIPLSQRFNPQSNDIRYSLGPLTSEEQRDEQAALDDINRGPVKTQVGGQIYTVLGKNQFRLPDIAAGEQRASQTFMDLKLPGAVDQTPERSNNVVFKLAPDGFEHDIEGRQLLEVLKNAIRDQVDQPSRAYATALVNAVRGNFVTGDLARTFGDKLSEDLASVAQSESSTRGAALATIKPIGEQLHTIARNLPFYLHKIYADAFGGDGKVKPVVEQIVKHFHDLLTPEEIDNALANNPDLPKFVEDIARAKIQDRGGKLYRRIQSELQPKKPLTPEQKEKNAFVEEAASKTIEEYVKAGGVVPKSLENQKLSPREILQRITTPETAEKIRKSLESAYANAEREAAKAALRAGIPAETDPGRKQAKIDELALLESNTITPDPLLVQQGFQLPKFKHWSIIKDILGYDPTSVKAIEDLIKSDFKGAKFGTPDKPEPPPDVRIDLKRLAEQPDAEVKRSFDAYLDGVAKDLVGATPETRQRVVDSIRERLNEQLTVIRQQVLDKTFAPKAATTPPTEMDAAVAQYKRLTNLFNAGLLKDVRAQSDLLNNVAGKSVVQKFIPSLTDLIKQVIDTPRYRRSEIATEFGKRLSQSFDLTDAEKAQAAKLFEQAMGQKIDRALPAAIKQVEASFSPREIADLKRTTLWEKIRRAVNSGALDSGEVVERIAEKNGWRVPTAEERDKVVQNSLLAQKLEDEANAAGNKGVFDEKIAALKHSVQVDWSRWSQPIDFTKHLPTLSGEDRTTIRANNARAINDFVSGNLLMRAGFVPAQLIDITTQGAAHIINRSLVEGFKRWQNDKSEGRSANLLADLGGALKEAGHAQKQAFAAGVNNFRRTLIGKGEHRNVEQLTSHIAAFDRLSRSADEQQALGNNGRAFILRALAFVQLGRRFAAAADYLHGTPAQMQELTHQIVTHLRREGLSRAEVEMQRQSIIDNVIATQMEAEARARQQLTERGEDASDSAVKHAAWNMVLSKINTQAALAGLPIDAFNERSALIRNVVGWNEAELGGPGYHLVSKPLKTIGDYATSVGIPAPFASFSNAIAISINRVLSFTPLGAFPGLFKGSPFFEGESNIRQRKLEAAIGTTLGPLMVAAIISGAIKVFNKAPSDEKEREEFYRKGMKAGTIMVDGVPISFKSGPLLYLSPWIAGAGAIKERIDAKAKAQAKLDAEADKKGLPHGQVAPLSSGDYAAAGLQAAIAAASGGRTASGAINSYFNPNELTIKQPVAAYISALLPYVPAAQQLSRMAGTSINPKTASLLDMIVPLPWSGHQRLNMLGDPVRTEDDVQRIVQSMTGGTYPFPIADNKGDQAYQTMAASNFRPPAINPNQGYAIDGTYRPLKPSELQTYAVKRGQLLKDALNAAGDLSGMTDAERDAAVKQAYQTANQGALRAIGASVASARGGSTGTAIRSTGLPHQSSRIGRTGRLGRGTSSLLRAGRRLGIRPVRITRLGRNRPASRLRVRA